MSNDVLKDGYRTRSGDVPFPGVGSKEWHHPAREWMEEKESASPVEYDHPTASGA